VARQDTTSPVTWYAGDVYAYAESLPKISSRAGKPTSLSRRIALPEGEYVVLVRSMYEIRMFGDPGVGSEIGPEIRFLFRIQEDHSAHSALTLQEVPDLNVVADVVDGHYMGECIGISLRRPMMGASDEVEVTAVRNSGSLLENNSSAIGISMVLPRLRIAPGQTRVLPIRVLQQRPLHGIDHLDLDIDITTRESNEGAATPCSLRVRIDLHKLPHWSKSLERKAIKFTHLSGTFAPTYGMLVPPTSPHPYAKSLATPTILALHGAGVSAESSMWWQSVPRWERGWTVLPTGLTEWGLDWHGASMESTWQARRKAFELLRRIEESPGSRGWPFSPRTM
jgi:hypothetical protein